MGTGIGSASDTVCPRHATMMQSMLPQHYEVPAPARDPSSQQAKKCFNCQSFFGSKEKGGLCSKCFMKTESGGGGTQSTRFDKVKMLRKVAGCSFKGVPELNNFCPDCYKEHYGPACESDQHPPQRPPKPAPRHRKPPLIDGSDTSSRSIQETNRLQMELRVLNETVTQKDNQVSLLRKENKELLDQIKQQQFTTQRHHQEKEQIQQEKEQLQQQLRRQTASNRQLQKRLDEELVRNSQVVEFWKVPPQDVHVFKGEEDILGRGAWGYVAKGRFRGQSVAVKCLHQAILDPRNVERVHREI